MELKNNIFSLAQIIDVLREYKQTGSPTALFLGAKAGGLPRSLQSLSEQDPNTPNSSSPLERYPKSLYEFHSPSDAHSFLIHEELLQGIKAEQPELYLAELLKWGILFNPILSVSIYTEFEAAFQQRGINDYSVYWPKSNTSEPHNYNSKGDKITLVKVFGDIKSNDYKINNDEGRAYIEKNQDLKEVVNGLRDTNLLIVGADQTWDQGVITLLLQYHKNGSIWYVDNEEPKDSAISDKLKECDAKYIIGNEGRYDNFFSSLYLHVIDAKNDLERYNKKEEKAAYITRRLSLASLEVTIHKLYSYLPSSVLANQNAQTMPLIKYEIVNNTTEAISVVLAATVRGFSEPYTDTIEVNAQQHLYHYQLPILDREKIALLTEIRKVSVYARVSYLKDNVEILHKSQDFDVYLMARNVICWAIPAPTGNNTYTPLFEHIAAWVTPRKESVRAMLREAVDYHPRKELVGYPPCPDPEKTRSQVKAIFLALKKVGKIAYVNSPFAIGPSGGDVRQAVRLPDDSLRERQANCIDGAVLYASLLEYAALHPIIVIRTGHAFVGWKTWSNATSYEFLETTMTINSSFEQACKAGMNSYLRLQENGWFNHDPFDPCGFARLLDIKKLHDEGIHPME